MTKTQIFAIVLVVGIVAALVAVLVGLGLSVTSYQTTNDDSNITVTDMRYSGYECSAKDVFVPVGYSGYWTNANPGEPETTVWAAWYNFSTVGCLSASAGVQFAYYAPR